MTLAVTIKYDRPMKSALPGRTVICGLEELAGSPQRRFSHVLSILDPARSPPETLTAWVPDRRLTLRFHDEIEPQPQKSPPTVEHVAEILTFALAIADDSLPDRQLLIHCHSGISRATAAAIIVWAQACPDISECDLFAALARSRPNAWPNSRMLIFADQLLGREGRLVAATFDFFRRRLAAEPELDARMHRLRRSRDIERAV